jgi:hypothetical protein
LLGGAPAAAFWAGTPLASGYLYRAEVQALVTGDARVDQGLLVGLVRQRCQTGPGAAPAAPEPDKSARRR